ncbi:MAG: bestrophin-like domain [Vulcanimicrobiaceae bacterium]
MRSCSQAPTYRCFSILKLPIFLRSIVAAKIILLDRVLAHYGPEANQPRKVLRSTVNRTLDRMWPAEASRTPDVDPRGSAGELLYEKIEDLSPKSDLQRTVKSEALALGTDIGQMRWLMFEQLSNSISTPLLVLLIFWFTIIFAGFGLFAPRNATVIGALIFCALSVSGAIFLMLEMYTPFEGMIHLSSAPPREALAQLGKEI